MIVPDKLHNALYALQGVLIRTRSLAMAETTARKDLASILDYAEHLPRLIASQTDQTTSFREILVDVADRYQCPFVLQRFDEQVPSNW
jgi:hypothetical protein